MVRYSDFKSPFAVSLICNNSHPDINVANCINVSHFRLCNSAFRTSNNHSAHTRILEITTSQFDSTIGNTTLPFSIAYSIHCFVPFDTPSQIPITTSPRFTISLFLIIGAARPRYLPYSGVRVRTSIFA